MYRFDEIIGATLEEITVRDAIYVDAVDSDKVLEIKGLMLAFDKGRFVIENPHTLIGVSSLREIIGSSVVEAFSNDDCISLKFNNGGILLVSLRDCDFVGPEAASYYPKQGEIIVFN